MRIISAPSILGLKPSGVELLADRILSAGLPVSADTLSQAIQIKDLNHLYRDQREPDAKCLNANAIREHALMLRDEVAQAISNKAFAFVPGGDCSILIGAMAGVKQLGEPGLLFMDAHADFYSPEKSITGEVADMDLAIVSGRGPELLTNIGEQRPYVKDENIIHIGQRDQDEATHYQSPDIRLTPIHSFSADNFKSKGSGTIAGLVKQLVLASASEHFWIHFDTDVLDDEINPAVDYRLPGGLKVEEVRTILDAVIQTGKCVGMTITIYNPNLDKDGSAARNIVDCISGILEHYERYT